MSIARKVLAWSVLFVGLALSFALFFGIIVLAAIFLGVGWAAAAFALQIGAITAGLSAIFAGERIPDEDNGWGEPCRVLGREHLSDIKEFAAEEGAVIPMPKRRA